MTRKSSPKAAAGKAPDIPLTADEAGSILGLNPEGGGKWRGHCPSCGSRNAFTLETGRIQNVVYNCFGECDRGALVRTVRRIGVVISKSPVAFNPRARRRSMSDIDLDPDAAEEFRASERTVFLEKTTPDPDVVKLLDRSKPGKGTVVEKYLHSRGITLPVPDNVLYCPYYKGFHVMVAAGSVLGFDTPLMASVTYLRPDGTGKAIYRNKHGDDRSRSCVGSWGHGIHIPLIDTGEGILGIGEGIETCLSAVQLGIVESVWACYCAGNIPKIVLPLDREIWFLGEYDKRGANKRAILEARQRLRPRGIVVRSCFPESKSYGDFNDVLTGTKKEGAR